MVVMITAKMRGSKLCSRISCVPAGLAERVYGTQLNLAHPVWSQNISKLVGLGSGHGENRRQKRDADGATPGAVRVCLMSTEKEFMRRSTFVR